MDEDKDKDRPQTENEIGSSRLFSLPKYFDTEELEDQVKNLRSMLSKDATAKALLNAIVLPLLAAGWTIEPQDPEAPGAEEQNDLVNDWLTRPAYLGGMTVGFDTVLAQCLSGVGIGFAAFEKVWQLTEDNYLTYRKIAFRPQEQIKIKQDARGGFDGLEQRANIDDNEEPVTIPTRKSFLYTHQKDRSNLYGVSSLDTCWPYYVYKRRYMYLMEQKTQFDAFGHYKVTGRQGNGDDRYSSPSTDELDKQVKVVSKMKKKGVFSVPKHIDVDALISPGETDIVRILEYLNAEMARSLLAGFMLLGSARNSTGSWSLSTDQSDFFKQGLYKTKRELEYHVNNWILPDLYYHNFPEPAYGRFQLNDISDETAEFLEQVFLSLVAGERLTEEAMEAIGARGFSLAGVETNIDKYFEERLDPAEFGLPANGPDPDADNDELPDPAET